MLRWNMVRKSAFRKSCQWIYVNVIRSVPLEQRCDGKENCEDKSDEMDCEIILVSPAYIKDLAPPETEHGVKKCNSLLICSFF